MKLRTILLATVQLAASFSLTFAADELPSFAKAEGIVRRHFQTLTGYQSGDLISRSQVEPVFDALERLGWKVGDRAEILNSVLPDGSYLVQQFRSDKGQPFMRKVSGERLAYDRLDQISRMPGGKLMIQDFLRFRNSELSLSSKSPLDISRIARLQPKENRSGAPSEADLDKPTGRLYTVDALVARLEQSYEAEIARRKQAK